MSVDNLDKKNQTSQNMTPSTVADSTSEKFPVAWVMMLGLIIAIGPLSIDMYLPALPSMAKDFGVTTALSLIHI